MEINTNTAEAGGVERQEDEILCLLHATLEGMDARLRRVRVRVIRTAAPHVCRLRSFFVRGDLLVVEARAATSREAIRAASKGLKEALSKRGQYQESSRGATIVRRDAGSERDRAELVSLSRRRPKAPRRARARLPPRVLLALKESESARAGLDWAAVFAEQHRSELHVLRVLADETGARSLHSEDWMDITRDVQRTLVATRETREWCDEALPAAVRAEHVCVRFGKFADEVVTRAGEISPDLIVLAAGARPGGRMASVMARAARRPVLVAREQSSRCTLLAATDLEDNAYPVLRKAAELGHQLHASVVAFHNVAGARELVDSHRSLWTAIQKQRLEVAADRLLHDGEVFVAEERDPALSIVAHARELAADTIVVGARARVGLEKGSVAADVVEQTDRTVIIVPIEDPISLG